MILPLEEQYGNYFQKLGIKLHYDPETCYWTYRLRKPSLKKTCTPIFIGALFTVARTWKRPRCPSADEWIKKLRCIYTMECYSAIERNAFESVPMRRMNRGLVYRVK